MVGLLEGELPRGEQSGDGEKKSVHSCVVLFVHRCCPDIAGVPSIADKGTINVRIVQEMCKNSYSLCLQTFSMCALMLLGCEKGQGNRIKRYNQSRIFIMSLSTQDLVVSMLLVCD